MMKVMMNKKILTTLSIITISQIWWWACVGADPQIKLLNEGCSQYNATSVSNFHANLNGTFLDLKAQLLNGSKHFATAQQAKGSDPVYAMTQCRNYLSSADCLSCFAAAVSQIRNCSTYNGARVIYDGCFLRYEGHGFFDQTVATDLGNGAHCENQTGSPATNVTAAAEELLMDLQVATPKINGFFAASKEVVSGSGNTTVYGMAQCAETTTETGCQDCLKVAYRNIQSCLPNTDGRAVDAGCFLRYSATSFFPDNQTTNITPFLEKGGNSRKKAIIIGVVVGGVGLILLIVGVLIYFRLSRKPKTVRRGDILGATELQGPVNYKYKDLKSATANFSDANKLGEGGFGDVYKATLNNGKTVAVKKLAILKSDRAMTSFENEVKLISNVHHRNLIRLLGCCSKGPELLLIYEYMANNSLDKFLFGQKRGSLNWKQRNDIILGTARGLAYLHEEFHVCIIHRDIKPSNILLDDGFQPRIADFGLARLLPKDQSHLSTRFAGTLGYTAPEYALHGQLSEKVDTYSYGVVLLEIVSGQKSSEIKSDAMGEFLLEKAWKLYENGQHLELVDETLDPNDYEAEDVKKIVEIALMCAQSSPALRPTMSELVVLLKSTGSWVNKPLTRPVFVDSDHKRVRVDTSTSTGSSSSKATASISEVSGR